MKTFAPSTLLWLLAGILAAQDAPAKEAPAPTVEKVREAIERGVAWLVKDQNASGSWGGPRNKTFTDAFANPATHDAWAVGTTGLVCKALQETGTSAEARTSLKKGLRWLCAHADVKRPAGWDIDNVWGYVYGLEGLASALQDEDLVTAVGKDELEAAARTCVRGLVRYQSPNGGWGYYADPEAAWRPEWATSFTTAAAVIALLDAEEAGIHVPAHALGAAVRAVARCRLPNGAYSYSISPIPSPARLTGIDQVKGSLGRIQVCNLSLLRAGRPVSEDERREGLSLFVRDHRFLDVALRKPIPHEAYYQNSGYFYLFGHYYAAAVLQTLPQADRGAFRSALQRDVLKVQEPDGAMWDFWISSHTRPYGTAFGVLALHLLLPEKTE